MIVISNEIYTIEELKTKISEVLVNFPVEKAVLFGSYAKGEATEKSDIDLIIASNDKLKGLKFYEVRGMLMDNLNKDVDLIYGFNSPRLCLGVVHCQPDW